uniref:Uncharacterized protein n=1 Tax=Cucumis melo TaxID=3656 RepID=A0A9I9ECR8_CUCME
MDIPSTSSKMTSKRFSDYARLPLLFSPSLTMPVNSTVLVIQVMRLS